MSKLQELYNQYAKGKTVVDAPGSGGVVYGNIAPYTQYYMWAVFLPDASVIPSSGELKPNFSAVYPAGSARVYYEDRDSADKAIEQFNPGSYTNHVYVLSTKVSSIANMPDENKAKFGEFLNVDVNFVGWGARAFAPWNLITFPSLIAAWARRGGVDVPRLDFSSLFQFDKDKWDDSFQERVVGHLDGKSYEQSELFRQRAQLWSFLGESDPLVSSPKKTKSENLGFLFNLAMIYGSEFHAKVGNVFDPTVVVNKSGERMELRVPVIHEIYDDEAAMKKAAEEDLAARSDSSDSSSSNKSPVNSDLIPVSWESMADDFKSGVKELRDGGSTLEESAEAMDLPVDHLRPYWESLG